MHDLQAYTVCGAEGEFNIFVTNGHPEDMVIALRTFLYRFLPSLVLKFIFELNVILSVK